MLLPVFWPFFDLFHQKFFARLGRTTVLSPGPSTTRAKVHESWK